MLLKIFTWIVELTLTLWTQVAIPAGSAIGGAIVGGLIAWIVAKKQMKKTGRQLFINTALQNEATRSTLPEVLRLIHSKESSGEIVLRKCKDQLWFEYLTSQSDKLHEQILNYIENEDWEQALDAFRRLLRGEEK